MSTTLRKTVSEVQCDSPPSKGARTRERLLDLAQEAVIAKGFAATSIDELVDAAGITKSGFFYHFRDKTDLSRQLLERYLAHDNAILDQLSERARSLSDDPLQSFLIFIKLFAEMVDTLPDVHPGCLVAAITYQSRAFDREVQRINAEGVLGWRRRFTDWIEEIVERYPPRVAVDVQALADHFNVVADGGIVMSRALGERDLIGRQARLLHDFVKLMFQG